MAKVTIWTGAVDGDWATAGNWSNGIPVSTDTVYIEHASRSIDTNLDQSAVTLAALYVRQSYIGQLGTAAAYLQIGTAVLHVGGHVGAGAPAGSPRVKIDVGTTACAISIWNSAAVSIDAGLPPIRLLANNAATTLRVSRGIVGLAVGASSETSTVASIDVGFLTNKLNDASVVVGPGVTVATLTKTGGAAVVHCAATTITNTDGSLLTMGTGAIGTLTVQGGTAVCNSAGTITTLSAYGGLVDMTQSSAPRTVTTSRIKAPGALRLDPTVITLTNPLSLTQETRPVTITAAMV